MKSAIQWFDDAYTYGNEEDSYYLITQVYSEIGQFNRDVTLKVEEAEDKGTYAPYFEDLQMMYEKVAEEENEIVNLETYKLCMYSIENYARKFMLDDISQEDLEELYQKVETSVKQITTTTDKTAEMKTDILERSSAAKQAIINAYET
jgi:serine/threonine-protein kinase